MANPSNRPAKASNKRAKPENQIVDVTPLDSSDESSNASNTINSSTENLSSTTKTSVAKNISNFDQDSGLSKNPKGKNNCSKATNEGLFFIVSFSASSRDLGKESNTDCNKRRLLRFFGKLSKTYSNSCFAADKTPSN